MRIASFNLENLDLVSRSGITIEERAEILRPQLERLRADILCLQEVNGQRVGDEERRSPHALNTLLKHTPYETFHRASTSGPGGSGLADVHNLVILSRQPIRAHRDTCRRSPTGL
jgi:exonuclease III